jgi:hydroxymethylbilane synthase
MSSVLNFATRPSALARWQTNYVIEKLQHQWPDLSCQVETITTRGDRILNKPLPEIGGKGLFTYELEEALLQGRVDAAVHSLKDLPTDDTAGLTVGVIPKRADTRDVLIFPTGNSLEDLPPGAVVGTSSIRRQAQLLAHRPDLNTKSIRGNVGTRIDKTLSGQYDAVILAAAGVNRLGLDKHITQYFSDNQMLPAPGQGALGVQYRSGDQGTHNILQEISDHSTHLAVTAERAFLASLGGGCSLPVGALGILEGKILHLTGVVAAPNGSHILRDSISGETRSLEAAESLGKSLAKKMVALGASKIISQVSVN